jgi:hypothetical protein
VSPLRENTGGRRSDTLIIRCGKNRRLSLRLFLPEVYTQRVCPLGAFRSACRRLAQGCQYFGQNRVTRQRRFGQNAALPFASPCPAGLCGIVETVPMGTAVGQHSSVAYLEKCGHSNIRHPPNFPRAMARWGDTILQQARRGKVRKTPSHAATATALGQVRQDF